MESCNCCQPHPSREVMMPFQCKNWQKSFGLLHHIQEKTTGIQDDPRDFLCDQCPKLFLTENELDHHRRRIHVKKKFPCLECDNSFSWKGDLNRHIKGFHKNLRPYACDICGQKFKKKTTSQTSLALFSFREETISLP
jgi:KRAB domain-containing zinc finger protein